MQKQFLAVVLMFFAVSSSVWAECGNLCDLNWWRTATASDVQAELDAGMDVSARHKIGRTPLHTAAIWGTAKAAEALITAGADVNTRHEYGGTPLHLAASRGNAEIGVQSQLFFEAALNGTAERVQMLIAAGADVSARGEMEFFVGNTPLHWAAYLGNAETTEALIAAGADVNARDEYGGTPLHSAAGKGTAEMVQLLIAAGADITVKAENGKTVWDAAQKNKKLAGTETLWLLAAVTEK